jgi:hypothetical protein
MALDCPAGVVSVDFLEHRALRPQAGMDELAVPRSQAAIRGRLKIVRATGDVRGFFTIKQSVLHPCEIRVLLVLLCVNYKCVAGQLAP